MVKISAEVADEILDNIKAGDDDECEEAQMYVCVRATVPAKFFDDLIGECSVCHEPVRYRPYGPKGPKKVCMECAMPMLEAQLKEEGVLPDTITHHRALEEAKDNGKKRN